MDFLNHISNIENLPVSKYIVGLRGHKAEHYSAVSQSEPKLIFADFDSADYFVKNWNGSAMWDFKQGCQRKADDYTFWVILTTHKGYYADDILMSGVLKELSEDVKKVIKSKMCSPKYGWSASADEALVKVLESNPERAEQALLMSYALYDVYGDIMDEKETTIFVRMRDFIYSKYEKASEYLYAEIKQLMEFYEKDKEAKEPIFREIAHSHKKKAEEIRHNIMYFNII